MTLKHKLLRISSRDRNNLANTTSSDFTITLDNIDSAHDLKSVVVKHISFTNTIYNITSKNNTLTYNIASSPTSVSIAVGQYTATQFKTALEAVASGIVLVMTLDPITYKYTLATTTAIEWLPIDNNPMAEILGISTGSGSDVTSHVCASTVNLSGIQNLFVRCSNLSFTNLVSSRANINSDVLAIIPITSEFGFNEQYISSHSEIDDVDSLSLHSGKNIQKMNIKLTDDDGDIVDMNGSDIILVLKVYY